MTFLNRVVNFINGTANFFMQFTWIDDAVTIAKLTYNKWFAPVVNIFIPPIKLIGRFYKWAFIKMAFKDGELSNAKAAGVAVPILAAFTWIMVDVVIPESIDFGRDAIGVMTEREELGVYLTGAGPNVKTLDEDDFIAKGCPELPCTDETANYYHIRGNSVKSLIRFFESGTIYYPEEVEAAIPDQLSKCDIKVQWFRWRLFRVYNVLSEVSCLPLHENE